MDAFEEISNSVGVKSLFVSWSTDKLAIWVFKATTKLLSALEFQFKSQILAGCVAMYPRCDGGANFGKLANVFDNDVDTYIH